MSTEIQNDHGYIAHSSQVELLRSFCMAESLSLLALIGIAVPLKHLAGYSIVVSVLGPIHGFIFLLFAWNLSRIISQGELTLSAGGKLLFLAFIPFGGIYSWWSLR
jgi:integral membrane protein